MSQTLHFYRDMKPFDAFENAFDHSYYSDIPDDWYIAVADVKNSTHAIENGHYKDVNMVGASCIISILNTAKGITDIPYVFGGDGASFAIPAELTETVAAALLGTQKIALDSFALDLRVCLIPVSAIKQAGKTVKLAKYALSSNVHIAMLSGGGIAFADNLAKENETEYEAGRFVTDKTKIEADLSGLECRWQPVKSERGQIVSLLVAAADDTTDQQEAIKIYQSLLPEINKILNEGSGSHPISNCRMKLTKNIKEFRQELRTRTYGQNLWQKIIYSSQMMMVIFLGSILFVFNKSYLDDVISQSDFQKFDDMIRMVVDCSDEQLEKLKELLDQKHKAGKLYYGMHSADSALITCMIFSRADNHVHFVDGAAGGYALAAQNLKVQIKSKSSRQAA